jgi:hypothetical protein
MIWVMLADSLVTQAVIFVGQQPVTVLTALWTQVGGLSLLLLRALVIG